MIRVAIYGYGNLGKGVEAAMKQHSDCQLVGVFTRRAPESVKTVSGAPVYPTDKITEFKEKIAQMLNKSGMHPVFLQTLCNRKPRKLKNIRIT